MILSFNYGISMQEAVRDICGETGKSELEVIEIIAGILLDREDPYLTAYQAEAGLDQNVRIEAWRAAGALLAILEYPEECLLESHIVKAGQLSLDDYVEVSIKYFRVSVAILTELLGAAEVFPIPKNWPGTTVGCSTPPALQQCTRETVEKSQSRLDQRVECIVRVVRENSDDSLAIRLGGKAKVRFICCKDKKLFTRSTFDKAWQQAVNLKQVRMADHAKFSNT